MKIIIGRKLISPRIPTVNGIKINAKPSKIKFANRYTTAALMKPTNNLTARITAMFRPMNPSANSTGRLINAANKPSGTVIRFKPGINAVNKPLSINNCCNRPNGNNNNPAPSNNGSAPKKNVVKAFSNSDTTNGIKPRIAFNNNTSGKARFVNKP